MLGNIYYITYVIQRSAHAAKTVFSRDDVVNAAFEIVKKGGLNDLSARRIAEELNSSTAPVYSCFKSMDELRNEVFNKAEEMMIEYTTRPYTRSVFLNMGTGLALFARDNRELFRALLLEGSETRTVLKKFLKFLRDELVKDDLISKLPKRQKRGDAPHGILPTGSRRSSAWGLSTT